MGRQTFRENVAQDLAHVFDCVFSPGKPECAVWPPWASRLHTQVTNWAVERFSQETPCRCGRDRFSDDGECVACPDE
ncbi:hypothetical protein DSM43518_04793 [Mycobacterium marinum]|uniref:hypothetical protein n=1 Tax=Mycobacterium marinum TaxID=1781 RepID=UPI000CD99845|nr:hypothetical protein [Mycobacterium marinum]AXN51251.1 hypothetical protein CCUG20998_03855 [Mycobacterium marinum]RFZ02806.1 hypothetical protein DSM43518_04793 [Mycobacterium marinum]RFZ25997.1 hypothetical protein DSM43519_01311 [Mycobacterium marinum]RFZ28876.1 hypothetical protein DSM44344_01143 [Mycobacterium marinum]RFZ39062.1 hypothetical protein NCTC2275_00330 [Mycobacterium marinum]